MPATVSTGGNVATFWWKTEKGYAAWLINHEYSEPQEVRLRFTTNGGAISTEVLFAQNVRKLRQGNSMVIEVVVDPISMVVVIVEAAAS